MNCKQGDLAIIVRALPHGIRHIGKIIECNQLVPDAELWAVPDSFRPQLFVMDKHLLPLRSLPELENEATSKTLTVRDLFVDLLDSGKP